MVSSFLASQLYTSFFGLVWCCYNCCCCCCSCCIISYSRWCSLVLGFVALFHFYLIVGLSGLLFIFFSCCSYCNSSQPRSDSKSEILTESLFSVADVVAVIIYYVFWLLFITFATDQPFSGPIDLKLSPRPQVGITPARVVGQNQVVFLPN